MTYFRNTFVAAMAAMAFAVATPTQAATAVDVELQLLIDVSSSVSTSEFNLQRQGYINAFNSMAVQDAILSTDNGRMGNIAVQAIYWSTNQAVAVNWMLLDSAQSIQAFAAALGTADRPNNIGFQTGIGSAINFGVTEFANDYDGTSKVIDVSGDGTKNTGASVTDARDAALAAGIDRINGIAIGSGSLLTYYKDNVIGGTKSFALASAGFDTFGAAIQTKLAAEISGENPTPAIPLPAAGWLLLTGLGGLAALRRRRTAA